MITTGVHHVAAAVLTAILRVVLWVVDGFMLQGASVAGIPVDYVMPGLLPGSRARCARRRFLREIDGYRFALATSALPDDLTAGG